MGGAARGVFPPGATRFLHKRSAARRGKAYPGENRRGFLPRRQVKNTRGQIKNFIVLLTKSRRNVTIIPRHNGIPFESILRQKCILFALQKIFQKVVRNKCVAAGERCIFAGAASGGGTFTELIFPLPGKQPQAELAAVFLVCGVGFVFQPVFARRHEAVMFEYACKIQRIRVSHGVGDLVDGQV